jgi:hypothetical protein
LWEVKRQKKMGAEKTQARDRAEAIVDRLGGFCSFFPPKFPNSTSVQEPQQTHLPTIDGYFDHNKEVGISEGLRGLLKVSTLGDGVVGVF